MRVGMMVLNKGVFRMPVVGKITKTGKMCTKLLLGTMKNFYKNKGGNGRKKSGLFCPERKKFS